MHIYRREPHENPAIEKLICWKSWQLCKRLDFNVSEREDIEQEIHMWLIVKDHYFDERRLNYQSFAFMIANQCVATLIRDRHALKRGPSFVQSLHKTMGDEADGELWEVIPSTQLHEAACHRQRTEKELVELRHDLSVLLNGLSDRDRDICRRLMSDDVSQVARDLKVPRSTLVSIVYRLRARLCSRRIGQIFSANLRQLAAELSI